MNKDRRLVIEIVSLILGIIIIILMSIGTYPIYMQASVDAKLIFLGLIFTIMLSRS